MDGFRFTFEEFYYFESQLDIPNPIHFSSHDIPDALALNAKEQVAAMPYLKVFER
jgi:hypothetical protein